MPRRLFNLVLLVWISAFSARAETEFPLSFDFGPQKNVRAGWKEIPSQLKYSGQRGYGFVGASLRDFQQSGGPIFDDMLIDGVVSADSILFRIDLPAGDYAVEIYMSRGRLSTWSGSIRLNDQVVATELHQGSMSFEEESPPSYWSLLRSVRIHGESLVLCISAEDQESTLCGVSVFQYKAGYLDFVDGSLLPREELAAPNAKLALKLINRGQIHEARRLIDAIPQEYNAEKAGLLLALSGRLEVSDPRPYLEWAAVLLKEAINASQEPSAILDLRLIELYRLADDYFKMAGWDWARYYTGEGIFDRNVLAQLALEKIVQFDKHPLYPRAVWYLGKIYFWGWAEQHGPRQKQTAEKYFDTIAPYYPDHRLLRMYRGEILPFDKRGETTEPRTPLWAAKQHQALSGLIDIIHYWVNNRQAENGEMGGKYDDDVEMLRWWPIARLAANDSTTLVGLERIVNGIWNSGWIADGFSRVVRDVEHAAEPVADTQPFMIGLDYGNPIYVERCMQGVKHLETLWTGVNSAGHRHFKSSWYSSSAIDTRPPRDCDVPMNARTVRAARWLAWYNRHPKVLTFLREWADAWLDDCLRTDKGKPYGIVPAAVRYEDDAIGGHSDNWHHPEMFWNYYNFHGGNYILLQLLSTYYLTGEKKYLQPIELALELVQRYENQSTRNALEGSESWTADILRGSKGFAGTVEVWRLLTGDSRFDSILRRIGSDYLKFRLTGEEKYLIDGCQRIIDGTFLNRELITSEGYFTDRIYIGNMHKVENWGGAHLEGMYTGSSMLNGFFPFFTITWKGFGEDFSAVITKSNYQEIEVLAYNASPEPQTGAITFWSLEPGRYQYQQQPETDRADSALYSIDEELDIRSRPFSYSLTLPSRSTQVVTLHRLESSADRIMSALADLAVAASELQVEKNVERDCIEIVIPVHNIGISPAANVSVELVHSVRGQKTVLDLREIDKIEAPLDLNPRTINVRLTARKEHLETGELYLVVDPDDRIPEITNLNNSLKINNVKIYQ